MFEFEWLWLLLLTPLPLLVYRLAPAANREFDSALQVPFIDQLESVADQQSGLLVNPDRLPWVLMFLCWVFVLLAASRPQWVGDPIPQTLEGRDLMLAIDLSESMLERDFVVSGQRVDRLTATKAVASDFLDRREGDRLGLILFGDEVYVQAPLTHDRATVKQLLSEAQIGLAGKATAVGDAIGLAVKRFKEMENPQRVLILLTDGTNTAGELSPLKAAEIAAEEEVRIYTVGIGRESSGGLMGSFFSRSSELDEKTLTKIAQLTGGQYFRARDIDELSSIYTLLDELEQIEQDDDFYRPIVPLFQWPLGAGILCWALLLLIRWRNS